MPIYEYTCSSCHKLSDVLQKLNEPPPQSCPACGAEGTLSRVVSRTSFVLKGGGWGADLYAKKKAPDASTPAAGDTAKPQPKEGTSTAAPAASGGTGGSTGTPSTPPSSSAPGSSSKGNSS